jgi:glycosyltransferase involved in cell wall biosynthesis
LSTPVSHAVAGEPTSRSRPTVSLLLTRPEPASGLRPLLAALPPCVDEVVVVGSSGSDVLAIAEQRPGAGAGGLFPGGGPTDLDGAGPDVRVVVEQRPGRGNALRAGLEAATGELIVAMDADGRMSPSEIPQFVYFLQRGFDLVRGSRFVAGGASVEVGPLRRIANRALLVLANRWFETKLSDVCYGYFAVRRHFLDHLELTSPGQEIEAEIAVRAALAGLRIAELPSRERARRHQADRHEFVAEHLKVLETLVALHGGRLARLGAFVGARRRPGPSGRRAPAVPGPGERR